MKKIATVVMSILFAVAAIAAGTSGSNNATAAQYDGPVTTTEYQPVAAEYEGPQKFTSGESHDYKLERESCCGPQS